MAEFLEVALGDVVEFFNGKAIKPGQEGEYQAYGSNGLIGGAAEWKYEDSIIIGRVGAYCGSVAYCKRRFWASDNTIVAKPKSGDVRYFFYLLKELGLNRYAGGAAQPLVTQTVLKGVPARVPDLSTQRRIASILSAYDDLIENNTRRIAILEEMARRIYEEWFVRFRFPGHEQVKMVESELGLIPEGWAIQGVYDLADVTYGFPFKAKEFRSDGVGRGVIRIRDIRDNDPCASTAEEADPKYLVSRGDILIGMDGQFHMGKWAGPQSWLNQRVLRLKPKADISRNFLFLAVREPIQVLEKTIVGTTVAHLSARDMKSMRLIIPSSQLMEMASEALEPLLELELNLHYKNANLRATRDLLLPKLISGELDVSTLPEPEEAMAA